MRGRRWIAAVRSTAAGVVMALAITALVLALPIAPWSLWQLGRRIGLW
jgi:hypothetical protein